jgi:riboflavin kinase/FMN adenylyltransferase
MNIHYGLDNFRRLACAVVTSGTFDGVHQGHRTILARLKTAAAALGGETVVITFWPHPRLVLFPEQQDLRLLTSLDEKAALLEQEGIDHLLVLPFSRQFAQTSSRDFIERILLQQIGTKKLVIGYDHRFGHNREGSFEYLKAHAHEWGMEVEEIPRHDVDNVAVSSTKIRKALMDQGDVGTANAYLGHRYMLTGKVVAGERIGRAIGYPTANVAVSEMHKLIPADGVYAAEAEVLGRRWPGMLYIGPRPTLGQALHRRVEINLFGFEGDIYGEQLRLYFVKKLRGDARFDGLEALQAQLALDRQAAEAAFREQA